MRAPLGGEGAEFSHPGADIGSDLHGYGGAAYATDGNLVWYVDRAHGNLWLLEEGRARIVMQRRADENLGDLTAAGGRLLCIRERADRNDLVEVFPDGTSKSILTSDSFLGSPRERGTQLVWLNWDADQMPWDGSKLNTGTLNDGALIDATTISGSRYESVTQPSWGPDGRLWFISDKSGWWNLYRWNGVSKASTPMAPMPADLAPPEWEAGYHGYAVRADNSIALITHGGLQQRLRIMRGNSLEVVSTNFTSFKPYLVSHGRSLFAVAGSPTQTPQVAKIDPDNPQASAPRTHASLDISTISTPEPLEFHGFSGGTMYALFYPPTVEPTGNPPPLIVRVHPGPTSAMTSRLDWSLQYFTGHGFAVVDVDYRGSSGYGRDFRRSLYGRWGTADVEDCSAVAEYLIEVNRAHRRKIFITGASAGGYTALQAISQPSVFAGAVARSAIIDPQRWRHTAPRWQQPHAAALAGPAGTVRAQRIRKPVLLIHGTDDHVAPLEDVEALSRGMSARGLPSQLIVLDARHELSAQHALASALEAELNFYRRLLADG
ncbi:prolyl oligopeptidase family serine peptidase [Actinoplanes sp. Pm04-4]|uniref:Prolyl oligopeptidase family serine peptidase n=1 Tax=Paractinoplanes pyxinae TaxID=2997416 RepID=A0ABT4BC40_9ACTN|nr:prolyl oligopeptidase family serine peptidase [Actinoplanes pyxinae]MCY1144046.1 prolyl oligopeptidase family serine peptidase [Actinoplanes pyxinae]